MPVTKEIDYTLVPEHTRGSMRRYLEQRIPPGGFLTAVLSNNLSEAVARADNINQRALTSIVIFLYNEAPSDAWGSPAKVERWLKNED